MTLRSGAFVHSRYQTLFGNANHSASPLLGKLSFSAASRLFCSFLGVFQCWESSVLQLFRCASVPGAICFAAFLVCPTAGSHLFRSFLGLFQCCESSVSRLF